MSMHLQRNIRSKAFARWPAFSSAPAGLLNRTCACGRHTTGGTECGSCRQKRPLQYISNDIAGIGTPGEWGRPLCVRDFSRIPLHKGGPAKARSALPEDRNKTKPSPYQGSATIQCDGSGGFEIVYGSWAGAACGTKSCVTVHESSHIDDWKAKWPAGCQGQPKGYLPKGDPPDNPLMTVAEYNSFLKKSECKAHTVDLACAEALPRTKGCEKTIDDYIKLTREQKANWCPGLSRGAKVGLGAGGGALAGAGIGFLAGGPLGAAIGAGIGALVGGIAGAFL